MITDAAVELLAQRLGTPLQIEQYLTRALGEGWRVGEKPVTAQLVETLLSPGSTISSRGCAGTATMFPTSPS